MREGGGMQEVDLHGAQGSQQGISRPASPGAPEQPLGDRLARRASITIEKARHFDQGIQTAETAKIVKYLHRFNLLVGFCLLILTGIYGFITGMFSLALTQSVVSVYCGAFGAGMILFELTTSAKVSKFFRTNYGFLMTFYGRCAFLFFVGIFSVGTSDSGSFAGCLAILDSFFHLYVSRRNPLMPEFIEGDDARRLRGNETDDTEAAARDGFLTRMANLAVEDPAAARAKADAAFRFANDNPEVMQAGLAVSSAATAGASGQPGQEGFNVEAAMRAIEQNPDAARRFAETNPELVAQGLSAATGRPVRPDEAQAVMSQYGFQDGGRGVRRSYELDDDEGERGGLLGGKGGSSI
eukprot:COSAG02_NODE_1324_length_13239_cov_12.346804_7_plen_354_part_00